MSWCLWVSMREQVGHHRQQESKICLLHDFEQITDLEVEVTILNVGKHSECKCCSSARSITTRNEVKVPVGSAHNKLISELATSSPFPSLRISICLHISKHSRSRNPNPTTFTHEWQTPSYYGTAKSNYFMDINNHYLKQSERLLLRLRKEWHNQSR